MIKNKKGIIVDALIRIIIAILVVLAVFNIVKRVAEAFFGGNEALQSFENLIDKMNSLENDEGKQIIVSMDEGNAIVGFSKSIKEFRCYGCLQTNSKYFSANLLYYSIEKPSNSACNNNPCACVCLKGLSADSNSGYILNANFVNVNCERFSCKTLKDDVPTKISLETALKKKNILLADYPYWENGFFFVRSKDVSNGINLLEDIKKVIVYIEKRTINQNNYVAACPELPCVQHQK